MFFNLFNEVTTSALSRLWRGTGAEDVLELCSVLSLIFASRLKPTLRIPVLGPGGVEKLPAPVQDSLSSSHPSPVSHFGVLLWTCSQYFACRVVRAAEFVRKPGALQELLGIRVPPWGLHPLGSLCPAPMR